MCGTALAGRGLCEEVLPGIMLVRAKAIIAVRKVHQFHFWPHTRTARSARASYLTDIDVPFIITAFYLASFVTLFLHT